MHESLFLLLFDKTWLSGIDLSSRLPIYHRQREMALFIINNYIKVKAWPLKPLKQSKKQDDDAALSQRKQAIPLARTWPRLMDPPTPSTLLRRHQSRRAFVVRPSSPVADRADGVCGADPRDPLHDHCSRHRKYLSSVPLRRFF